LPGDFAVRPRAFPFMGEVCHVYDLQSTSI
jgi:hypothetical protein